jgi:hypothetical protein
VTGEDLEEPVRELCKKLRLIHYHVPNSVRMERGMPDDIIVGRGGILWRERKGPSEPLSSDQKLIGYRLRALGQDYGVWRPEDLASGRIERELQEIA